MQPILSGVSGQIRSATLEADRDEGADAVERADKEISDKIEEQEQSDRVDVGESLDTVDEPVAQDVIDDAKLDAWQSKAHPDIADVGATDYEYTPPFFTESLDRVFSTSETLSENGIEFTAVSGLDIPEIDMEEFEFDDVTYRLQLNGVIETPPDLEEEGTLAKKIAPQDTAVAVTFSEECADEFPSLHYLAPGNPLLHKLIDYILAENDTSERLSKLERPISISSPTVVSAWGRNGTWATVTEKGDIEEVLAVDQLTEWLDEFVANRKLSS